jgi:hypothetical protein
MTPRDNCIIIAFHMVKMLQKKIPCKVDTWKIYKRPKINFERWK